ncbi:CinA family protein [Leucobacter sp. GX24907]
MTEATVEWETAAVALALAKKSGWRIAVAESLTGGLLADAFVQVPGASAVFSGGVVAYDTEVKRRLLHVEGDLLERVGPVDAEVAKQMARGVRACCATTRDGKLALADVGLATTGVAGPAPDPQTGLPAGTVWIAVSSEFGEVAVPLEFAGDREAIREAAVAEAVQLLIEYLSRVSSSSAKTQE